MRPFWNSKHLAGHELMHIVCGQVSQTSGSTVMWAYSWASVTNFVAPRRALTLAMGSFERGDGGASTARGLVAVVGPAGPGGACATLGSCALAGLAPGGAWLVVVAAAAPVAPWPCA